MKKFITILLCIALFVCIVPTTTLVQQEVSNDVPEIERVTESFLSSLARNTYLYEDNDLEMYTLAAIPQGKIPEGKKYVFADESLSINDIYNRLQYIEDVVVYDKFYYQEQGITRENFRVGYRFEPPEINDNTATIKALETKSFYYTHDPLNNDMTASCNTIEVQLVKEDKNWYVVDISDNYSFCEDAKAQGIDLDVAIKEASLYIAAQKATAEQNESVSFPTDVALNAELEDETSIKSTTEQFLTLLAKEMYLYEAAETDTLTIASLDFSSQDDSINQIIEFYKLSELKTDLETIDALAEYTKFYREISGITRENFNVSYSFSDIEIYDDYATLTAKEHISFHYTHMSNFNELTELINSYSIELVKVNGIWFIAKMVSDCIFTPDAIERGINLEEAISQISAEMASISDDGFEDAEPGTGP